MVVLGRASDDRVEREFEGLAELVTKISRLDYSSCWHALVVQTVLSPS